jgi:hypothetical protein
MVHAWVRPVGHRAEVFTLSAPGGQAEGPRFVFDQDGDGVVTWHRRDGDFTVVQGARYLGPRSEPPTGDPPPGDSFPLVPPIDGLPSLDVPPGIQPPVVSGKRAAAGLRITRLRRVGGHVRVRARIARVASGRVTVVVKGRKARVARRARVRRGKISTRVPLPGSLRGQQRLVVRVRYAGSTGVRPAAAKRVLRPTSTHR